MEYQIFDGEKNHVFKPPENWEIIKIAEPKKVNPLTEEEQKTQLLKGFENPIGTKPLKTLLKNKNNIVIVVDDISRPTPTKAIINTLIEYIEQNTDISLENIKIIFGLGVHRKMTPQEAEKKLGKEIIQKIQWENHDPYKNLEYLGKSSRKTPIYVNKTYLQADFKIVIGLIEPHLWAGFSGGNKGIIPGIAGVETIYKNHQLVKHKKTGVGKINDNPFRQDIDEIGEKIGMDFLINVILTPDKKVHRIVTGHQTKAFLEGVKIARNIYEIPVPQKADVIISSPVPLGIDFRQSSKAAYNTMPALKKGGVMIVVSACPEGMGNVKVSENPPKRSVIKILAKILPSNLLMKIIRKQGYGIEDAAGTFQTFKFISKYHYIFVTQALSEKEKKLLFVADHVSTLEEAIKLANKYLKTRNPKVSVFPKGGASYPRITN